MALGDVVVIFVILKHYKWLAYRVFHVKCHVYGHPHRWQGKSLGRHEKWVKAFTTCKIYLLLFEKNTKDNFMIKPFSWLAIKMSLHATSGTSDFSCHGHLETGSVVHTLTTRANACLCCPSEHVGTWIYIWWTDKHSGAGKYCCVQFTFCM